MMKPNRNRIVAIVGLILAVIVLAGIGSLLRSVIRAGRVKMALLPREAWGFGAQRYYWLVVGNKGPRDESTVYRLGVFIVVVRTRSSGDFDPRTQGAIKVR
jgi:hypothetical protein